MNIVFDIGGTYMRVGVSSDGTVLDAHEKIATPQRFSDGVDMLVRTIHAILGIHSLSAVAGGIAGVLNSQKTGLIHSPHLRHWIKKPLVETLKKKLGVSQVFLENDAALAGLGEAHCGAGKANKIVMYYTVGTGVGGARIVDGIIDVSAMGFEPGHQVIAATARKQPQTLETFASGSGMMFRYQTGPAQITDERIWREASRYLAYGLTNSIVHWSPDVVVLGGSLILSRAIDLSYV